MCLPAYYLRMNAGVWSVVEFFFFHSFLCTAVFYFILSQKQCILVCGVWKTRRVRWRWNIIVQPTTTRTVWLSLNPKRKEIGRMTMKHRMKRRHGIDATGLKSIEHVMSCVRSVQCAPWCRLFSYTIFYNYSIVGLCDFA